MHVNSNNPFQKLLLVLEHEVGGLRGPSAHGTNFNCASFFRRKYSITPGLKTNIWEKTESSSGEFYCIRNVVKIIYFYYPLTLMLTRNSSVM